MPAGDLANLRDCRRSTTALRLPPQLYMNERPTRPRHTRIREAFNAHRVVYGCATLLASMVWLSAAFARNSFTDYNDVQQVLAFLSDILPPELRPSDLST